MLKNHIEFLEHNKTIENRPIFIRLISIKINNEIRPQHWPQNKVGLGQTFQVKTQPKIDSERQHIGA